VCRAGGGLVGGIKPWIKHWIKFCSSSAKVSSFTIIILVPSQHRIFTPKTQMRNKQFSTLSTEVLNSGFPAFAKLIRR